MDDAVENLIRNMARIPGLGPRSARRAALFLLQNRERLMVPLAHEMNDGNLHTPVRLWKS